MKFGFDWPSGFRGEFEHCGRRTDGQRRTPEHGYPISSPIETKLYYLCVNFEFRQQTEHSLLYKIKGQHLNTSTLCTLKYMNISYFSKTRY